MSAKETVMKWKISKRRVQRLCAEGKIEAAMKVGMVWVIPSKAIKPFDNRRKTRGNL